ncbi:unnamed protein product [Ilex paraguariensis]|uniref:PARP alpha-helical domain-containing protein n=1 Tax=Ilex paraguariensis TaxID=185542 RepID=A0ABC8UE94_9AQUA
MVPENDMHMYYKKGIVYGYRAEERLEERDDVDGADDGIEVRHGGLRWRQLGFAVAHCKLDRRVANFMNVLCYQGVYRYALMEMGLDVSDIPIGMVSNVHLERCEELLLELLKRLKLMEAVGLKAEFYLVWNCVSVGHMYVAYALETVRDITVASYLIGDMTGPTIDDPLSKRYKKLGCSISSMEKGLNKYHMILTYLERTYEPIEVGDHFGRAIVCFDAAVEAAKYAFMAVDRPEGFLILAIVSLGEQVL